MRTVFIEGDCNIDTCDDYARRFVAYSEETYGYSLKYKTNDEYLEAREKASILVEMYLDREKKGWRTLVDGAPPEAWEALCFQLYDDFMSTQTFSD